MKQVKITKSGLGELKRGSVQTYDDVKAAWVVDQGWGRYFDGAASAKPKRKKKTTKKRGRR